MTDAVLTRARAGDDRAFHELTGPYLSELRLHCYRILGSVQDAEDVLQETLLAAWRGLGQYQERASLRTWLYRIATNRCLNALRDDARRPRQVPAGPPFDPGEPSRRGEPLWLQPYPDVLLNGLPEAAAGPEARYEAREAIALAFVTALQGLPPRQRAVLVLRDVLGYRAAEAAAMLDITEISVNSALRRARAALPAPGTLPRSAAEGELAERFAAAYAEDDIDAVVALLTDDAWYTMPPVMLGYQGPAAIAEFLRRSAHWRGGQSQRLIPVRANGQPAFGRYWQDKHTPVLHAHGLIVLAASGPRICAVTAFVDNSVLPPFGLPRTLPTVPPDARFPPSPAAVIYRGS
jgi:RNA polymerase sigma-70 factor (TIGR02960 family)